MGALPVSMCFGVLHTVTYFVLSLVTAPVMMTMVTMMKGDGDVVVDDHDDDGLRGLLLASVSKNDIVA